AQPVELVAGQPELLVKKLKHEQVKISLNPPYLAGQSVVLWQETPTRLRVIEITDDHRRIGQVLGSDGIEVPLSAREQVLEALGAVSSLVMVHSDIGGVVGEGEAVAADPQPRVHLLPEGAGLRVEILVRPFGNAGPYFPPGTGGKALFTEVEGKRLHTERDLKGEKKLAQHLADACAVLAQTDSEQDFAWQLEEPESCLELLLQLQSLPEHALIEWPQGERFKLAGQAGLKQLSVKVRAARDWFSLSGEIRLDSGQVLNMQRLLELMGNGESRFIQLDDGHFLALTDAFRKRLADLNALAESHGKERRIHALAAPLLEELAEEAGEFVSDQAWRERIARLRSAETLQPVLPGNLQAELRDYQIEGYNWLARLAHWGVGACLADDMGLGKTLQALALMLSRAPEGPSLVIAPTSVCLNWHSETVRFAPTLKVNVLGAGDRQKQIEALGPMDLLICSYALLQQSSVAELLSGIAFRTIVLDEAQAIKNMTTKRSQSAMNLQGEFKLITTGTPVENHLGELWNLFRFINPGLLGSLESFNRRFAGPIERGEKDARQSLKRLVQAFVLRRLKSQVLDELPSRTEITLTVELSEQERAFYEALRRQAMAELERSDAKAGGEKHLQVLVAIMKLRRACCHSSLATPGISLPSSKLALFGETLEELLVNRHKALVFSQFIDHLGLIRAYLDDKGISYQYLDGQTPAAERKKRVDAFQAGQGDVFLISLKAGGVGLNLTAADYVIHMDPWWNPAVEDQASDRAHRMGQMRPVTIYRLVAKDTIEEKIVALHRHKRDLADSVLSGSDSGGKISTDELLRLIREA
ncbi:MAG: DEAD/DEAH box helicase, partial [Methylococcaceae bacterium]